MKYFHFEDLPMGFKLPNSLRKRLQEPFGRLFSQEEISAELKLKDYLSSKKFPFLITIGDVCSKTLVEINIFPDIMIVDGKTLRTKLIDWNKKKFTTIDIENRPGMIENSAWNVLKDLAGNFIREKSPYLIWIFGEEDLLIFPVILEFPLNSYIVYGQPPYFDHPEGLVLVKITSDLKKQVYEILHQFEKF